MKSRHGIAVDPHSGMSKALSMHHCNDCLFQSKSILASRVFEPHIWREILFQRQVQRAPYFRNARFSGKKHFPDGNSAKFRGGLLAHPDVAGPCWWQTQRIPGLAIPSTEGGSVTRSVSSALSPFFGGGFPYQSGLQKKGTLILTSLLEDPGEAGGAPFFRSQGQMVEVRSSWFESSVDLEIPRHGKVFLAQSQAQASEV